MDNIILDLDGVEGESNKSGYEKKIEILSYNHGVSMQVTGDVSNQERTSGAPNVQDLSLTKYADSSSNLLRGGAARGHHL